MTYVFVMHHVREGDEYDDDDAKLIGVYSSVQRAEAARARLSSQPGFVDYPEGFGISKCLLNQDHWQEGFVRLIVIYMPLDGEGTDVWCPVQAELLSGGRYEVLGEQPEDQRWRFPPGTVVRCVTRIFDETEQLVASHIA